MVLDPWPWKHPKPSPDWPMDLQPGACLPCYLDKGIDRPREHCRDHVEEALDAKQAVL